MSMIQTSLEESLPNPDPMSSTSSEDAVMVVKRVLILKCVLETMFANFPCILSHILTTPRLFQNIVIQTTIREDADYRKGLDDFFLLAFSSHILTNEKMKEKMDKHVLQKITSSSGAMDGEKCYELFSHLGRDFSFDNTSQSLSDILQEMVSSFITSIITSEKNLSNVFDMEKTDRVLVCNVCNSQIEDDPVWQKVHVFQIPPFREGTSNNDLGQRLQRYQESVVEDEVQMKMRCSNCHENVFPCRMNQLCSLYIQDMATRRMLIFSLDPRDDPRSMTLPEFIQVPNSKTDKDSRAEFRLLCFTTAGVSELPCLSLSITFINNGLRYIYSTNDINPRSERLKQEDLLGIEGCLLAIYILDHEDKPEKLKEVPAERTKPPTVKEMNAFQEKEKKVNDLMRRTITHMCACGVCNKSLPLTNEASEPSLIRRCSGGRTGRSFCFTVSSRSKKALKNYIRAECAKDGRTICWMCTFDLEKRPFASEFQSSTDGKIAELRSKFNEFKKAENKELKLNDQALMASVMRPTELDHLRFGDFGDKLLYKNYSTVWLSHGILSFVISMLNNLISHFLIYYHRNNNGKLPALKPVSIRAIIIHNIF